MRVIGGDLGGRRLDAPTGAATRPTSDRVREAIFNILPPPPPDARVLDLFAGSGALGIEALSRGAGFAVFVDEARAAQRCLEGNLAALGLGARARLVKGEVLRTLAALAGQARGAADRFDWIFLDPPYAADVLPATLTRLGGGPLLGAAARVVVEHDRRVALDPSYGALELADARRYGDTSVSFYRRGQVTP